MLIIWLIPGSQGHGEDRTNFFLSPSLNSIGELIM